MRPDDDVVTMRLKRRLMGPVDARRRGRGRSATINEMLERYAWLLDGTRRLVISREELGLIHKASRGLPLRRLSGSWLAEELESWPEATAGLIAVVGKLRKLQVLALIDRAELAQTQDNPSE